jgi:hypothetical protein
MDGADTAAACSATPVSGPRVDTVWQAIAVGTIAGLAHRFGPVEAVAKMGIAGEIISVGENNAQWIYRFRTRCMAAPRSGYTLTRLRARQVDDSPHIGPNILQAPAPPARPGSTARGLVPVAASSGPCSRVDCLFFQSFSTTWLAVVGQVGDAGQGAYTLRTGTETGPHIEGPGCLISLPGKL